MKKIKKLIFPILILCVFITLMTSVSWIKQPMSEKDDVMKYVEWIEQDVKVEDWQQAKEHMDQLKKAWEIVLFRVQFSSNQERIFQIETGLALLKGDIIAQDQSLSIIELETIRNYWEQLEN